MGQGKILALYGILIGLGLLFGGCARQIYLQDAHKARYAQDTRQAILNYQKAGALGSAQAYESLGWMYLDAKGVPQDISKAILYFHQACKLGSKQACVLITRPPESQSTYLEDLERAVYANDRPKMIAYLQKMGQMGNAHVLFALGELSRDTHPKQAIAYYQQAAKKGDADAYHALGFLYEAGLLGVSKNMQKAIKYYKKGGALGNPVCFHILGTIYDTAQGVPKDRKKAQAYFLKACDLGLKMSCGLLKVSPH